MTNIIKFLLIISLFHEHKLFLKIYFIDTRCKSSIKNVRIVGCFIQRCVLWAATFSSNNIGSTDCYPCNLSKRHINHNYHPLRSKRRGLGELPYQFNWGQAANSEKNLSYILSLLLASAGDTYYWLEIRCFMFERDAVHCDL